MDQKYVEHNLILTVWSPPGSNPDDDADEDDEDWWPRGRTLWSIHLIKGQARPSQAKSMKTTQSAMRGGPSIYYLIHQTISSFWFIHIREGRITIIVLLFLTRSWVSHGEWSSRTRRPSVNLILKVPWAHDKMIRGIILCSDFCYTANKSIVAVGQLPITCYSLLFALWSQSSWFCPGYFDCNIMWKMICRNIIYCW